MYIELDKVFHFKITNLKNHKGIIEYCGQNSKIEEKHHANVKFEEQFIFKPQSQNIVSCIPAITLKKNKYIQSSLYLATQTNANNQWTVVYQAYAAIWDDHDANYPRFCNSFEFFRIFDPKDFPFFADCVFNIHENLYNLSLEDWTKNYNPTEESIISNYKTNFLSLVEENEHPTR